MDPSYNNSFDSFGVNSAGGDIVLTSKKKGKAGKVFLIVGIILFLITICVIVALFLLNNHQTVSREYEKKFNIFVNDVYSGESVDLKLESEINKYGDYYFGQHYTEEEYINRLISEYVDFAQTATSDEHFTFDVPLEDPLGELYFLADYNQTTFMDSEYIINVYEGEGVDVALNNVESYYTEKEQEDTSEDEQEKSTYDLIVDWASESSKGYLRDIKNKDIAEKKYIIDQIQKGAPKEYLLTVDYKKNYMRNIIMNFYADVITVMEGMANE